MEIKKVDFEKIKSTEIDFSFEDLDVNGDNVINKKDRDLTQNTEVFNMITRILNSTDEEDDFNLIDDFDYNAMKSGNTSAQCLDGNCQFTVPTKTANENASTSNLSNLASTNDCPDGNCSVSLPSEQIATTNLSTLASGTNNSDVLQTAGVQNPDGTTTETKTNANGQLVEITYDANGKKISAKTTDKDGNVFSTTTYKYNDNGSYSATIKYSNRTRTAKYNSNGKITSYTDKYKNGKIYNATYKYNADGSYTATIKNKKNGAVTTKKYNTEGKVTSSVTKNKKGKTTSKVTYNYNVDGSYKKTTQQYKWSAKVVTENYDKEGNKITKSASDNNVVTANAGNYKNSINQNGVSYVVFTKFDGTCGHCSKFKNQLSKIASALDGVANFVSLDISGGRTGSNVVNNNLAVEFSKKYNATALPLIVKFVNGKPTEEVRSKLYKFDQIASNLYDKIVKDVKESTATKTSTTTPNTSTVNSSTNTQKNKTAPTTVTSKNYKSKIAKKGVTYLIMGDTKGCGGCMRLDKQIKKLMKNGKLQNSTILSMNISDKDGSSKIFADYVTKYNMWNVDKKGRKSVSYPQILKLVDGVPVGFVTDIKDVSDAEIIKKLS